MQVNATWELPKITTVYQLERVCTMLGSHYFDEDTKRYFGSKVLEVKPTKDGAIFRETASKPGWVYVRQLVVQPGGAHDMVTHYKADRTAGNMRTARYIFNSFKEGQCAPSTEP